MTHRPGTPNGLRHLALLVPNLEECERFYVELMGMTVLHRANPDLVYLTCGNDNLSLGRLHGGGEPAAPQRMDHFGFIVDRRDDVDAWHAYLRSRGVTIVQEPFDHRDGARSFYFLDPAGNEVQPLYHPAVSGQRFSGPD